MSSGCLPRIAPPSLALGLLILSLLVPSDGPRRHGVPRRLRGLSHVRRGRCRGRGRRRRASRDRAALLDRAELPRATAVGRQDLGQRARRRGRARGPVRRRDPCRRAHGRGDDPQDPPLAGRRIRVGPAGHQHRQHPRGLDHLHGQPRWGRLRHRQGQVPRLAQEPAADARHDREGHRPQSELRVPLGRGRPDELEPARDHLSRTEGVLDPRSEGVPGLPGQPRHRRAAADPDGHQLPRDRPAGHVAVRLHEDQRPGGHDRRGPQCAGPDRSQDGRVQRLPARTGERPVHQLRHLA